MASNYFDFDTDVTLHFVNAGLSIKEMPIPIKYGDDKSRVNVFYYGLVILRSTYASKNFIFEWIIPFKIL